MRRTATSSTLILAAVLLAVLIGATPGAAQDDKSLELLVPALRDDVPPDCSSWRELYPMHGAIVHQDGYVDDGDGAISACDHITLDGQEYHIELVGPTYHLVQPGTRQEAYMEPRVPTDGRNPMCEIWHEVYPDWCNEWHVDGWEDDGSGDVSVCDWVFINGIMWHIEEIGLNIYVVPQSPVEPTTWGKIKAFVSDLLGSD